MRAKLLINQKKKSKNIYLYFPRYKLGVTVMLSKLEAIVLNIKQVSCALSFKHCAPFSLNLKQSPIFPKLVKYSMLILTSLPPLLLPSALVLLLRREKEDERRRLVAVRLECLLQSACSRAACLHPP